MKNQTNIYLYEDTDMSKVNIPHFIRQWNEMNIDKTQYKTTYISNMNEIQNESIILINKHLTDKLLDNINNYLNEYPNSSICVFLSPREILLLENIDKLIKEHEHANIGTILKPTQFSKVKTFIDSATVKDGSLELEDNWEDFNFSEFL